MIVKKSVKKTVLKKSVKTVIKGMKIEVLGTGCPKCKQVEALVKDVVSELKIKADVIKVSNIEEIIEYGVMGMPALFIDGKEFVSGRIPSKEELIKKLKK